MRAKRWNGDKACFSVQPYVLRMERLLKVEQKLNVVAQTTAILGSVVSEKVGCAKLNCPPLVDLFGYRS